MARVNISLPNELIDRARQLNLNVSGVTAKALADEIDRHDKIRGTELDLAELEAEFGPISDEEMREARDWVRSAFPSAQDGPAA